MSEGDLSNEHRLSEPIAEFLRELQQTPQEYWPNLLQMMRLFRETVTTKPGLSNDPVKTVDNEISKAERIQKNQGAIELLQSWEQEGDEIEQTETWEYLRKALDEDRLSNRPLWAKFMHDLKNPDPVEDAARQKALSELLRSWREEGDEEEQKETGDYLRRVLDEDRLSNRPLFP